MIPDGTSSDLLSIARWYNIYQNSENSRLAIDNYLCGYVKTHCSNSPIGDSAPTTSAYMTGVLSQAGFVSTYPPVTLQDLTVLDSTKAYQPLITLLEAAKYVHRKATGLVFTCEFPQATPADCAAHTPNRKAYKAIAKQMVYNNIDVVIGGGTNHLQIPEQEYLIKQGYEVLLDNSEAFRKSDAPKLWSLFEPENMPYSIDRDSLKTPSLAEMTRKAIRALSQNKNGFFLMVEGSLIDWAAHDNDPKTMIADLLDFDAAVAEALDFANRDGETVVIILPDHATGGISLGNRNSNDNYARLSLESIMQPLQDAKMSHHQMSALIKSQDSLQLIPLFKKYYNITLTSQEVYLLYHAKDYENSPFSQERRTGVSLQKNIAEILNQRGLIGFTSYGHTGEDVFLAIYHPYNDRIMGFQTNLEIHRYLSDQLQLEGQLTELTRQLFTPHQALFQESKKMKVELDSIAEDRIILRIKSGKNILEVESYTNYYTFNGKHYPLNSVIVYQPENRTFYLPKSLKEIFQ